MAIIEDAKKSKRTGLENLSLIELFEVFVNKAITFRERVDKFPVEEHAQIKRQYLEETKDVREEINKREHLYLEGHRTNVRY